MRTKHPSTPMSANTQAAPSTEAELEEALRIAGLRPSRYSPTQGGQLQFCICGTTKEEAETDTAPAIQCSNRLCQPGWFHIACVGLDEDGWPEMWLCPSCAPRSREYGQARGRAGAEKQSKRWKNVPMAELTYPRGARKFRGKKGTQCEEEDIEKDDIEEEETDEDAEEDFIEDVEEQTTEEGDTEDEVTGEDEGVSEEALLGDSEITVKQQASDITAAMDMNDEYDEIVVVDTLQKASEDAVAEG